MDLGISGRTAIVCASSKGLGFGCAQALAEAGCRILLNGRNLEALHSSADQIRKSTGSEVIAVAGDISEIRIQRQIFSDAGDVDILVNNNAGPPRMNYTDLDREAIVQGVVQNMVTPIELIKAVTPGMIDRKFGRIINITSGSVLSPIVGLDLSSGARAGLTAFLAGVTRQLAPHGITVNNLLPGKFDTDRLNSIIKATAASRQMSVADAANGLRDSVPSKRFGTPEEFGQTCAFLCSVHAGYITGQNILMDGGLFPAAF